MSFACFFDSSSQINQKKSKTSFGNALINLKCNLSINKKLCQTKILKAFLFYFYFKQALEMIFFFFSKRNSKQTFVKIELG
jgi:hypothetical protein